MSAEHREVTGVLRNFLGPSDNYGKLDNRTSCFPLKGNFDSVDVSNTDHRSTLSEHTVTVEGRRDSRIKVGTQKTNVLLDFPCIFEKDDNDERNLIANLKRFFWRSSTREGMATSETRAGLLPDCVSGV